jgi:hypothetical protein
MSLDLRTGKPVWNINKPRIARHKKLTSNIRSEVVVVGESACNPKPESCAK